MRKRVLSKAVTRKFARYGLFASARAVAFRVAALSYEIVYDSVEGQPVIKAFVDQLQEVGAGLGSLSGYTSTVKVFPSSIVNCTVLESAVPV